MKKAFIVLGAILVALLCFKLAKGSDPACIKLEAKLSLAKDFCAGLGRQAAETRCDGIGEGEEARGACIQAVFPYAVGACYSYIQVQELERSFSEVCR